MARNLPPNLGEAGGSGLTPGKRRSPREGNCNPYRILAWKIPWTEEPVGLPSMGLQSPLDVTEYAHTFSKFFKLMPFEEIVHQDRPREKGDLE